MSAIGWAIREARGARGEKQGPVASRNGIDRTLLSKIENGHVPGDPEVLRSLAQDFDCPRVYKQLHQHVASGVFVHRWLDGEVVDLHRSSVRAKALEELNEAIDALLKADLVNRPMSVTDEDRERLVTDLLFPLLGAEGAIEITVSVVCQEYQISPSDLYARWNRRMEQLGYQKKVPTNGKHPRR